VLLPWLSVAITVLMIILLVRPLLFMVQAATPWQAIIGRVERWAFLSCGVVMGVSALLLINGLKDVRSPIERSSVVLAMHSAELDVGHVIPLSLVELTSWDHPAQVTWLLLHPMEERRLWPGQSVVLQLRTGLLAIPWVAKIERDDAAYFRQVTQAVPNAVEAWKRLINFQLDHHRWDEVFLATQDYLKRYPRDYEFAGGIAAAFGQARRNVEAAQILALFLDDPLPPLKQYELYNLLGWAWTKIGRFDEGVTLLKASIPLDPESWWAYYHLGYAYRYAGHAHEAMAMFQEVLARRPHFPGRFQVPSAIGTL
jgi:hypothetical protein